MMDESLLVWYDTALVEHGRCSGTGRKTGRDGLQDKSGGRVLYCPLFSLFVFVFVFVFGFGLS